MSSFCVALHEELQCSICLDVFTDPVTTPCGHNFCRTCLNQCWTNTQTCCCPLCKETFSRRPDLKINTTLTKVVQHFKNVSQKKDYICQKHERPLELFCRDDQMCVCLSCTEGDHRTHNTVPIEEESQQKKTHASNYYFFNTWMIIGPGILMISILLIFILPRSCSDDSRTKKEITDLKRRNTELEQNSHTDDHLHLIQVYSSLYSLSHTKNWIEISTVSDVDVLTLKKALTVLKKELNKKLSQTGSKWAPKFAVDVTLDPDTANPYLILSDDGKQVSHEDIKQDVPENPKRFDTTVCVLAKQGFSSGRFYYEVQVKGKCILGVARESFNRREKIRMSPVNGFWTVILRNENQYTALESPPVSLSLRVKPEKVGVFVDYKEGLVSFYDVGHRSHIYSFTDQTFTDKLYPFFRPGGGKNAKPLIITPVS